MLANFLNKSKPINFIGLLIFFFIGFLFCIYSAFFTESFEGNKIIKSILLLFLFLTIFFFYNFVITKNNLTQDNTYAYFIFTLLTMCILSELINYKILTLTIIYLLFVRKIYSFRSSKKVLEKLFDSGFWLGIFFMLEPLSILLFVLIYVGSYLHKKITLHTLLVPVVGFITPLFVYFTYLFWYDKTEEFENIFKFDILFDIKFYSQTKYFLLISSILFFTLCAIFFKSAKALSVNNTFRKNWVLLIYNFLILIFFSLLIPQKNGSELIFILFPASIILANGVELIQKPVFKNSILYLFIIGSIISCFLL